MFFSIDTFMTKELGLSQTPLLVYALVWSFSREGSGCYWGSMAEAADTIGAKRRATIDAFSKLIDAGLILNIGAHPVHKTNQYIAVEPGRIPVGGAENAPVQKMHHGGAENALVGVQKMHPIINSIKDINNITLSNTRARDVFIIPSVEDIKAYCLEQNIKINTQLFYNHYSANGWMVGKNKMKDWKAAVRSWAIRQEESPTPAPPPKRKMTGEEKIAQTARVQREAYLEWRAEQQKKYGK